MIIKQVGYILPSEMVTWQDAWISVSSLQHDVKP